MKIGPKITITVLCFSMIILFIGLISISQINQIAEPLANDIPNSINELTYTSELDGHAQFIRYYDEVLTQSARNYAFTMDPKWEERYRQTEPLLNAHIKDAIEQGKEIDKQIFSNIDTVNLLLVEMEYRSIDLVNNGQNQDAVKLLESEEYWNQKKIYEDGLRSYASLRNLEYSEALLASTEVLTLTTKNTQNLLEESSSIIFSFIAVSIVIATILGFIIYRSIVYPIQNLESAANKITNGLYAKISVNGDDEIHHLAESFNIMTKSLKQSTGKLSSALKEIKKTDVLKDEFAAMVSHELRTPLYQIVGYSELLLSKRLGTLNPRQSDALKVIHDGSTKLEKLIDDILTAQKLEMDLAKFDSKPIDVEKLLSLTHKSHLQTIKEKKIEFVNNFSSAEKLIIKSDVDKITEVFTNLIGNSVDFVREKTGRIEIDALQNKNNEVIFSVKDNGIGIPIEKQKNLFKKFYQVDTSLRRKRGGSGLGLAICKGIVEKLGGRIWVESELHSGSTFYFSIPEDRQKASFEEYEKGYVRKYSAKKKKQNGIVQGNEIENTR